MFYKDIQFSTGQIYLNICEKEDLPSPIKTNIPEWFKKLEHNFHNRTIKGCMPFLDTLTNGYLLKFPQDMYIKHNFLNEKNQKISIYDFSLGSELRNSGVNLNFAGEGSHHDVKQVQGSHFLNKHGHYPLYKIKNPWHIKTPSGYSCLFVPPLNNSDDRFEILSGIVDTDSHPIPINFPFVINGDKYKTLETTIKKGTPYVHIIPFKRDNWKMKILAQKDKDPNVSVSKGFWFTTFLHIYKNKVWSKKIWK